MEAEGHESVDGDAHKRRPSLRAQLIPQCALCRLFGLITQELAAAKAAAAKGSAGGGAKGAAGGKSSGGGKSGSGRAGGGSAADKAAADKAEKLLQAELDKLGKELATVKLEASTKGREAAERAAELEKVRGG